MNGKTIELEFTKHFRKAYSQLPKSIQTKVDRQLRILSLDRTHPGLRIRKMTDMGGIFEGRIDARFRFTFQKANGVIYLRELGTHNIYQRP